MNSFWLVLRKELTCCARDPDVLIYAFLLPIVLYPLCAVFVNEASLWYSSMQEKNKPTVIVSGQSPLAASVAQGLRRRKHFSVYDENGADSALETDNQSVKSESSDDDDKEIKSNGGEKNSSNAKDALNTFKKTKPIDDKLATEFQKQEVARFPLTPEQLQTFKNDANAVVTVDSVTSKIDIKAHETASHFGTIADQLESDIRASRFRSLRRELHAKALPTDLLLVYTVQRQGLKKVRTTGATDNNIKQLFDKLLALLVVFMILMMTVIGGPASVCMMAEEHEKKTYQTTLLLPINRMVIIFSKFLTVASICIVGATFNLFCLTIFAMSLLTSAFGQNTNLFKLFSELTHITFYKGMFYTASGVGVFHRIKPYIQIPTFPEVMLLLVFVLTTGALLAAIYLCVAGYAKTVKSAQMLVSLPMIFLMSLPTLALIPGIQFTVQTSLVPIANLLIMRKFENPPLLPSLIALLEPIVLIVLILNIVRIVFESHANGKRSKNAKPIGVPQ
ncbi:MAG TPA: ABC transporter permease [Drouetiella sp.]